jgi:hypothetical protein
MSKLKKSWVRIPKKFPVLVRLLLIFFKFPFKKHYKIALSPVNLTFLIKLIIDAFISRFTFGLRVSIVNFTKKLGRKLFNIKKSKNWVNFTFNPWKISNNVENGKLFCLLTLLVFLGQWRKLLCLFGLIGDGISIFF